MFVGGPIEQSVLELIPRATNDQVPMSSGVEPLYLPVEQEGLEVPDIGRIDVDNPVRRTCTAVGLVGI